MTRFLVVGVSLLLATGQARAFCIQGSDVNGALDYLVCLHNEQAKAINDLADTVSGNADISNSNSQRVDDMLRRLDRRIDDLEQEVSILKSQQN